MRLQHGPWKQDHRTRSLPVEQSSVTSQLELDALITKACGQGNASCTG